MSMKNGHINHKKFSKHQSDIDFAQKSSTELDDFFFNQMQIYSWFSVYYLAFDKSLQVQISIKTRIVCWCHPVGTNEWSAEAHVNLVQ